MLSDGIHALLLAPIGSGKTLATFLAAIDQLVFEDGESGSHRADRRRGVRVVYVSPLKALGVDVDRNLRAPIAGATASATPDEFPARRTSE